MANRTFNTLAQNLLSRLAYSVTDFDLVQVSGRLAVFQLPWFVETNYTCLFETKAKAGLPSPLVHSVRVSCYTTNQYCAECARHRLPMALFRHCSKKIRRHPLRRSESACSPLREKKSEQIRCNSEHKRGPVLFCTRARYRLLSCLEAR